MSYKLIRDKIGEGLDDSPMRQRVHQVDRKTLPPWLAMKIEEEAEELAFEVMYGKNKEALIEELADVMEVVRAIRHYFGISLDEVEDVRFAKEKTKGGFRDGWILTKER